MTGKTIDFVKKQKQKPETWIVVIYEYDHNKCTHALHLVMPGIFVLGSFYSCL